MDRIEINVQTGEQKRVTITQRELDEYASRDVEYKAQNASLPPSPEVRLKALEAWAQSMGYIPK